MRLNCFVCGRFIHVGAAAIETHGHTDGWLCADCNDADGPWFDLETGEETTKELG